MFEWREISSRPTKHTEANRWLKTTQKVKRLITPGQIRTVGMMVFAAI